jgi:hypothetical protein
MTVEVMAAITYEISFFAYGIALSWSARIVHEINHRKDRANRVNLGIIKSKLLLR